MPVHTVSSRDFTRDVSAAKRAAADGPVFITDRGRPAFALLKSGATAVAGYARQFTTARCLGTFLEDPTAVPPNDGTRSRWNVAYPPRWPQKSASADDPLGHPPIVPTADRRPCRVKKHGPLQAGAKRFTESLCLDPSPHPAACTRELPLTCSDRTYRDELTRGTSTPMSASSSTTPRTTRCMPWLCATAMWPPLCPSHRRWHWRCWRWAPRWWRAEGDQVDTLTLSGSAPKRAVFFGSITGPDMNICRSTGRHWT